MPTKNIDLKKQKALALSEFKRLEAEGFLKKDLLFAREIDSKLSSDLTHPEALNVFMEALKQRGISIKMKKSADQAVSKKDSKGDFFLSEKVSDTEEVYLPDSKGQDPVRLYLRKIGSVSLLDRKGEVAISKDIERGEKEIMRLILMCPLGVREVIRFGEHLEKISIEGQDYHQGIG